MNTRTRRRRERKRKYLLTFPYSVKYKYSDDTVMRMMNNAEWCSNNFSRYMWSFNTIDSPKLGENAMNLYYEFRFTREKDLLLFLLRE